MTKQPARDLPRSSVSFLLTAQLEYALLGMLVLLSLGSALAISRPSSLVVDLPMLAVAAAALRWPRPGGTTLALALLVYLTTPESWLDVGLYAPLVVVFGMGVRKRKPERRFLTALYLGVICVLQYGDYTDGSTVAASAIVWGALFAAAWLTGGAYAVRERALVAETRVAAAQQRQRLALSLHDDVARHLSHASLLAQLVETPTDSRDLAHAIDAIQEASAALRLTMQALQEPEGTSEASALGRPFSEQLNNARVALAQLHIPASVQVEGDLDRLTGQTAVVLSSVFDEAIANIQRHAQRGVPCDIVITSGATIEVALTNGIKPASDDHPQMHPLYPRLGLAGMRTRIDALGGSLTVSQEGTKWTTLITLPQSSPETPSGSSSSTTT